MNRAALKTGTPVLLDTLQSLRAQVVAWRSADSKIALVPTMGALHAGHIALTQHARACAQAQRVIVSIFVNPTQFAPHEDFSKYPRTFEADVEKLTAAGVDLHASRAIGQRLGTRLMMTAQWHMLGGDSAVFCT